jgi:hypothetical protein
LNYCEPLELSTWLWFWDLLGNWILVNGVLFLVLSVQGQAEGHQLMDIFYIIVLVILLFWLVYRLVLLRHHAAAYRCRYCRAEFQPSAQARGPNFIFYRYLKCPRCHKRGWAAVIRK